jgi:hypothetical protein
MHESPIFSPVPGYANIQQLATIPQEPTQLSIDLSATNQQATEYDSIQSSHSGYFDLESAGQCQGYHPEANLAIPSDIDMSHLQQASPGMLSYLSSPGHYPVLPGIITTEEVSAAKVTEDGVVISENGQDKKSLKPEELMLASERPAVPPIGQKVVDNLGADGQDRRKEERNLENVESTIVVKRRKNCSKWGSIETDGTLQTVTEEEQRKSPSAPAATYGSSLLKDVTTVNQDKTHATEDDMVSAGEEACTDWVDVARTAEVALANGEDGAAHSSSDAAWNLGNNDSDPSGENYSIQLSKKENDQLFEKRFDAEEIDQNAPELRIQRPSSVGEMHFPILPHFEPFIKQRSASARTRKTASRSPINSLASHNLSSNFLCADFSTSSARLSPHPNSANVRTRLPGALRPNRAKLPESAKSELSVQDTLDFDSVLAATSRGGIFLAILQFHVLC